MTPHAPPHGARPPVSDKPRRRRRAVNKLNPTPEEDWQLKGALAASALDFRRRASDVLDALLVEMIRAGSDIGTMYFRTKGGRMCSLMLSIGETAVDAVRDRMADLLQETETPDTDDGETDDA